MPVEADPHWRGAGTARADQIGRKSEFLRKLIDKPCALRQKIVEDKCVTIAQKKDGTARIRRHRCS